MGFVVTVEDMAPPPRGDNQPWTQALIYEGATQTGTWSLIDTINLSPLDADPLHPTVRDFTTTNATADSGLWYSVIFKDAANNGSQRSLPMFNQANTPEVVTNYRPTVSDVAEHIGSRTVDDTGNEIGDFTGTTTPTAGEVDELIDDASAEVASVLTATVPDAPAPNIELYREAAADIVATRAAALVELRYYGKEVARENSPFKQLMDDFGRQLLWLATKLGITVPGNVTGGSSSGGGGTTIDDRIPLGSHNAQWGNVPGEWNEDMLIRPF